MAGVKGTVLTGHREFIRKMNQEESVLERLVDPELKRIYLSAIPITWIPAENMGEIIRIMADVLYPGDKQGVIKLGQENAKNHFGRSGMYKFILKIVSLEMILERVSVLWKQFHEKGEAKVIRGRAPHELIFVVAGYPELPEPVRQGVGGEALGLLQMTGANDVVLREDYSNPEEWKWIYQWRKA